MVAAAVPHIDAILSSPEGRRQVTQLIVENYEHIPADLIAHQIRGAAAGDDVDLMIELGREIDWSLDPQKIECPVRIVGGASDRILPWPGAAEKFRSTTFPHADWVELEGVGHCPQLDVPVQTTELIRGFTRA